MTKRSRTDKLVAAMVALAIATVLAALGVMRSVESETTPEPPSPAGAMP